MNKVHFPAILQRVYDDPTDAAIAWLFRDQRMKPRKALATILIKRRRQIRSLSK
jgi:hypothetical protein